jgi:transcriptional regulator with XRE-family HTH domain
MMPAMDEWRRALRDARERLGLSRDEAACLSGVSMNTVKSYELGRRRPLRHHLGAVLTAYRLNREEQRPILEGAGFVANDGPEHDGSNHLWHSADEAEAEVQRHDWPAFVLDEFVRVVAANDAAQRLWGVDLRHEFTSSVDRNLLSVASNPRFADRCVNWDETIGIVASVFKAHDWAPERVEQPGPYFAAVLDQFMRGDEQYVARFLKAWNAAPSSWERKARFTYPVVWDEPGIGIMRFESLASPANDPDGLAFNDWIPLDAATWRGLEELKARAPVLG